MTKGAEMILIDKMYGLVVWTSQHVVKFPRTHRFTLGGRLEDKLNTILEALIRAKYTADRLAVLNEANLELERLRFQFRLAKDLKCLPLESYGYASRTVNEVGQLVGGWIKKSAVGARA
jgi:hypothetical protein